MNFSGNFGDASTIWYPASGCRGIDVGALYDVGSIGRYWSVTPNNYDAYYMTFDDDGDVFPPRNHNRAYGFGVRCVQE